jgi:RHS repeat-associated protein
MATREDAAGTTSYGYDPAGRLATITNGGTGVGVTLGYNQLSQVSSMAYGTTQNARVFGYDGLHRQTSDELKTSTGTSLAKITYDWDDNDNLIAKQTAGGTLRTRTDAFGQVTSQESAPGTASEYTYDGLGRLTGAGLAYTGVANTLAADGATTYTRDPGGMLLGAASGSARTLVWTDQHTDVVGQLTPNGAAVSGSRVFDPWGAVLTTVGMLGSLGYQSAFTDAATGRVNMRARWYNPGTGQFDTRDAANVGASGESIGANRYAYAEANPMTNVDQDGTWSWRGLAKAAVNTAARAARAVVNTVVAVAQAVYTNVILPVVHAVANVVTSVARAVVNAAKTAANWAKSAAGRAMAAAAKQAAAVRAWVAAKAEQAKRVAAAALVQARQRAQAEIAKVQRVYAEAKAKVADAYHAGATWVAEHKTLLIEIAAIGAGILAGMACTAATGGLGAVACMAGAMALINLAKDAAQGNIHNWGDALGSLGTGAMQGLAGAAGGAIGGKFAAFAAKKMGGFAASLAGRTAVGAASGAIEDTATQLLTTGDVDWTGVAMAAGAGALSGGRARGRPATGTVPKGGGGHSGGDIDAPSPRRGDTDAPSSRGDSDASPGDADGASCPIPQRHSFDPNTRVVMADGSTKPIKDINVGDKVKTTDPTSGANGPRTVTTLHHNQDTDLTDVTVTTHGATIGAATTVLATTSHHPFWDATTNTWVNAGDLVAGHQLHTDTGTTVTVVQVTNRDTTATGGQDMRDLTIADIHTYYVVTGDTPVLVHNCGGEATVHLDFSNPEAKHALITIRSDAGEVLSTHQFGSPQNPRAGVETFDAATLDPKTTLNVKIRLPNAGAAMAYAEVMMDKTAKGTYPAYSLRTQSCVTYCAKVLHAGGVEGVPTTPGAAQKWLIEKLG